MTTLPPALERLLRPITADDPCGADLSFSAEFDRVLELRREDDPTLDPGAWKRPLKLADWPGVSTACERLLVERTKDLRVVGWWTDAQARLRGWAGLADGLAVCERLCARWWDELHPRPDDAGDLDRRIGALGWLLGQVAELVRRQVATPGAPDASDADPLDDARRAAAALARLEREVDARTGVDGPAFDPARRAIDDAIAGLERRAGGPARRVPTDGDRPTPGQPADAPPFPGVSADTEEDADGAPARGRPPRTRTEALRQLRAVAEFFRRTEPHSPVGYLADKAAGWGEMPLHDWLRVVLKDAGALAHVEELLGIGPPAAP